jgi:hypothetical protein
MGKDTGNAEGQGPLVWPPRASGMSLVFLAKPWARLKLSYPQLISVSCAFRNHAGSMIPLTAEEWYADEDWESDDDYTPRSPGLKLTRDNLAKLPYSKALAVGTVKHSVGRSSHDQSPIRPPDTDC